MAAVTGGTAVAAGAGVGVGSGDGTDVGAIVGVRIGGGVKNTVAVASGIGLNVDAAARVGAAFGGWVGITVGAKLAEPALAFVAAGNDTAPVRGGIEIAGCVGFGVLGLDVGATVAVRAPLVGGALVLGGVEAVAVASSAAPSRVPRVWPQAASSAPFATRVTK